MNLMKNCLVACLALVLLVGCESEVTQETIDKKEDQIAKLEKELKSAKSNGTPSDRISELEAELDKKRNELEALEDRWGYEKKMEAQLRALDRHIDQFQRHAADATDENEVELRKKVAELRTLYDQLEAKMDELRVASGEGWVDSKEAVEKGWKKVSDRVEKALNELPEIEKSTNKKEDANSEDKDDQSGDEDK